jgi:hypothetical protein
VALCNPLGLDAFFYQGVSFGLLVASGEKARRTHKINKSKPILNLKSEFT